MRKVLLGACVGLAACRSVAAPDPSPHHDPSGIARPAREDAAIASADAGVREAPNAEAKLPPLDWGTRPPESGVLFPIVDGMCIHGRVFALDDGTPIFVYGQGQGVWSRGFRATAVVVGPRGVAPERGQGFGDPLSGSLEVIGGPDRAHMFAIIDMTSRMLSASQLSVGGEGTKWSVAVRSGNDWVGDDVELARKDPSVKIHGSPIPLGGGRYLVPEQYAMPRADSVEVEAPHYRFRQIEPDGKVVTTGKLPEADLAKRAFEGAAVALPNGDVIGAFVDDKKLVRWSPRKPVDDLPLPPATPRRGDAESGHRKAVAGKGRAAIELAGRLYVYAYDTERVSVAKVSPLPAGADWTLLPDDSVLAVDPKGGTKREAVDGTVIDGTAPAAAPLRFFADKGEVWLVLRGKGPRGSDALHRLTGESWEPVPLPEPPFGNDTRSKLEVEGVTIASKGDVFVNVRRVEKGLGWSTTEPYRAIYRTKRPDEVLRCMDVRHDDTGTGLWSWPPNADASCKTPVVTVLTEAGKTPAKDYPNVRAALRGKTTWGDTLTFMNVEGRGYMNLVVAMDDVAKAKALATHLSKSLDLRADVVCGKPAPVRTLTFDVAKGTFATP